MMGYRFSIIAVLVLSLWSSGCSKETELPSNSRDFVYFPIRVGSTYYYSYDSVWVDCVAGRRDTFRREIKEVLDSIWLDGSGSEAVRVFYYMRTVGQESWGVPRVYSMRITEKTAERIRENFRYISLSFPLELNKEWDGNRLNSIQDWGSNYKITELHQPWNEIDSTVLVVQKFQENLLTKSYFSERYGMNIGLVHKKSIEITGIVTDPDNPNDCSGYLPPAVPWSVIPIQERIKFGYVVEQILLDYVY
jgi:hypothetical protein